MKRKNSLNPNRDEYIELILDKSEFNRTTEVVSLRNSLGRVTAEDIHSLNTLPNRPTSAMDGIAIRYEDIASGDVDTTKWKLGEDYIFCNTGVMIPSEYDTAIPIEMVELDGENITQIKRMPSEKGERVNQPGDMMKEGDLLVPKDYLIKASQLGLLASGGIRELEVIKKPKVAIIPTGDELIQAGLPLHTGKNIETNSIVMEALVDGWGGEPVVYPIIPDDPEQLYNVLCQAVEQADIIILNAGTSKGNKDYAISILDKVGQILVYQVAHGPAKPTTFTIADGKPILGLVGPPIGAELTANWYIRPLIDQYLNQPTIEPDIINVRLEDSFSSPLPFDFYNQILISKSNGEYIGTKVEGRIDISTKANGILQIPVGVKYEPGDRADVELKVPVEYIDDFKE